MDLAAAEELLDYQLASCPEEALWLDMTKIMCYAFPDYRHKTFRQSGHVCAQK